jgi:lipopolysaccharide/colanic/teichoic acid biosynthesis glycosyltransferase
LTRAERGFKRMLDLLLGTVLLVLSLPVMLVAAAAIVIDSPGPVLFRQARVGAGGRVFRLWKLRTMKVGADDTLHREYVAAFMRGEAERQAGLFKVVHDPRITRVGRFLRRSSLDEVPQFWNVLCGHMSLVGPRPPTVFETELYQADSWLRLRGRPGVTGLWQVSGRSLLGYDEMVDLDVRYWDVWSPALEVRILCKTVGAVLFARGAA